MEKWKKFFKSLGLVLRSVLIAFASYLTSWAIIVGIIWVIFKIFRLSFDVRVATGFWVALLLLERAFENMEEMNGGNSNE